MGRLVMKFGGTSVGDIPRIRNVAKLVQPYETVEDATGAMITPN